MRPAADAAAGPAASPAGASSTAVVVPLPGSEATAATFASLLDAPLAALAARRFPDGERYLRLETDVRGREAVVFGLLRPPDEGALTLRFLGDLLREMGARRVTLVLPYLPYMRQDARFQPGEAVTAASFARHVSGCVDALVTVDPHLHRVAALGEIYAIPARVVPAAPAVAAWVAREVAAPVIVGPDAESAPWVEDVARRAGCPALVLRKQRLGDRQVRIAPPPPQAVAALSGRTPVLVDDILSSGRTLAVAVRALCEAGLAGAACVAVHGLFSDDAAPLLEEAGASRLVTANTVPGPRAAIDVLPDVAAAVRGLLGGG